MSEDKTPQPFFGLEKIYLKDVSYEAPGAPAVFLDNQAPEVSVQIQLGHRSIDVEQGFHEVILTVHVDAKRGEKSSFLVEVQQAGVFRVRGLDGEALDRALEVGSAYVLLPFAREVVSDLLVKGGFPQLLINPINFDALYEQKRAAQKQPVQGNA